MEDFLRATWRFAFPRIARRARAARWRKRCRIPTARRSSRTFARHATGGR
jgi:hypothetical protein